MPQFKTTAACALALAAQCLAGAALACAERDPAIAAVDAGAFAEAERLYQSVEVSPDCDDAFRDWLAERLAQEAFRVALFETATPEARRAGLERSLAFQPHWRTHQALADLAAEAGDRTGEAAQLQAAINRLNEGPAHHSASEEEIAALFERATVAVRLAEGVVDIPATRDGSPGGILSREIRGFTVSEVPLPITFEFDSTAFSPEGEAYARMLLDHLISTRPVAVHLQGHTDPSGSEPYNDQLSFDRAMAVKSYLEINGFTGRIEVSGRGERDLPATPVGIVPGSEEHYRLARRVVYIRS